MTTPTLNIVDHRKKREFRELDSNSSRLIFVSYYDSRRNNLKADHPFYIQVL